MRKKLKMAEEYLVSDLRHTYESTAYKFVYRSVEELKEEMNHNGWYRVVLINLLKQEGLSGIDQAEDYRKYLYKRRRIVQAAINRFHTESEEQLRKQDRDRIREIVQAYQKIHDAYAVSKLFDISMDRVKFLYHHYKEEFQ